MITESYIKNLIERYKKVNKKSKINSINVDEFIKALNEHDEDFFNFSKLLHYGFVYNSADDVVTEDIYIKNMTDQVRNYIKAKHKKCTFETGENNITICHEVSKAAALKLLFNLMTYTM